MKNENENKKIFEKNKNYNTLTSEDEKDELREVNEQPEEEIELNKKVNSEFSECLPTISKIDLILGTQGYNLNSIKLLFLTSSILAIEGLHLTLFSLMIIPLTNYFKITDYENKLISSILFLGVGLGSFISGSSTVKYGRPFIINLFTSIIFISNVLMAYSHNFVIFAIFRFIIGFSAGLIVPMSVNLLAEYLPLKFRSIILTGVWTAFVIGVFYLLFIMYIFMPNLEVSGVSKTLFFSSFLPLFSLIINLFLLHDSPRNLIIRNKSDEAILILEQLSKEKIDEETKKIIINEVLEGVNKELSSNIWEIFNKKYLLLTVLLSYIWCINSLTSYGPNLISSLTLKSLGQATVTANSEIIFSQFIINLINLPANIVGGILSELYFLGRNKSTLLTLALSVFFVALTILFPKTFTLFYGLSQAFTTIVFNVMTTYSCEVYPTKIRDQAIGYLFFCTRFGGFISQILFLYLQSIGLWWPYYFTIIFLFINIILVYFLPFETYGQPLDADYVNNTKKI